MDHSTSFAGLIWILARRLGSWTRATGRSNAVNVPGHQNLDGTCCSLPARGGCVVLVPVSTDSLRASLADAKTRRAAESRTSRLWQYLWRSLFAFHITRFLPIVLAFSAHGPTGSIRLLCCHGPDS